MYMNKTKKYSIIMPTNNSTRKSGNSATLLARMNPAYKKDIKERKEREKIKIRERYLRNLAIQISKQGEGDNNTEEVEKLPVEEKQYIERMLSGLKKGKSETKNIESPIPVIHRFASAFDVDHSKGITRSKSRREVGGKRKNKKGKRKSTKKK